VVTGQAFLETAVKPLSRRIACFVITGGLRCLGYSIRFTVDNGLLEIDGLPWFLWLTKVDPVEAAQRRVSFRRIDSMIHESEL